MKDLERRTQLRERPAGQRGKSEAVLLAPTNTGRAAMQSLFYTGLFSALPVAAFYFTFGAVPYAAALVLPRVALAAARLSSRRMPAYEDTSPAYAAMVLSGVTWVGLLAAFPALQAFDYAQTVVWQLIAGGFLFALGPGTVLQWADLPRQIYFPVQPPPRRNAAEGRQVVRGQAISSTADILAERGEAAVQTFGGGRSPDADPASWRSRRTVDPDSSATEPPGGANRAVSYAGANDVASAAANDMVESPSTPARRWSEALGFVWGGVWFGGCEYSNNNRFIIGMSGSGKTLTFRLLMESLLPWPAAQRHRSVDNVAVRQRSRQEIYQALIYDAKTEQVSRLMSCGFTPGVDLLILNPLDRRAMVWDVARDVRDMVEAEQFGALIVDDLTTSRNRTSTSEHFTSTARRMVYQVVQVLQQNQQWRLRDLIQAFASTERIKHVLKQHPDGGGSIAHLGATEEGASVYSTLKRYLDGFSIVAAVWDAIEREYGAERLMSLSEWVEQGAGSVLLLPDGDENETVTRRFNQFLFRRLTKLLLSPDQLQGGRVRSVFFDELPTTGRLPGLETLLAKGRDYGVLATIGVQDIAQMFDVYGKDNTSTIVNNCPFRAYMKSLGTSARWCADQVGKQVVQWHQANYSYNQGRNEGSGQGLDRNNAAVWLDNYQKTMGSNFGASVQEREQDALLPSHFSHLPDIEKRKVVAAFYSHPEGAAWLDSQDLHRVLASLGRESAAERAKHQSFVKVPAQWQRLRAWEAADFERLGIPVPEEFPTPAADPGTPPPRARRKKRGDSRRRPGPSHDF